jgi:heme exporter protein C
MKRGFTILAIVTGLLLSFALYEALIAAPTERTMGDVQRIFYYHVPSAWTALALFLINFLASIQFLVRPHDQGNKIAKWVVIAIATAACIAAVVIRPMPFGVRGSAVATSGIALAAVYFLIARYFRRDATDILAMVAAEVGVVFCTIVLVTGPIWAKPVWGIWWETQDIRLNSTLALWLIYVSYLLLRQFSTSSKTAAIAAAWAIFGALDVPFVFFSIWFYRTQHPSPVIAMGGSLDPRMAQVLLVNWAAFLCLAWLMSWTRFRLEVLKREVEEAQSLQSLLEPSR